MIGYISDCLWKIKSLRDFELMQEAQEFSRKEEKKESSTDYNVNKNKPKWMKG